MNNIDYQLSNFTLLPTGELSDKQTRIEFIDIEDELDPDVAIRTSHTYINYYLNQTMYYIQTWRKGEMSGAYWDWLNRVLASYCAARIAHIKPAGNVM